MLFLVLNGITQLLYVVLIAKSSSYVCSRHILPLKQAMATYSSQTVCRLRNSAHTSKNLGWVHSCLLSQIIFIVNSRWSISRRMGIHCGSQSVKDLKSCCRLVSRADISRTLLLTSPCHSIHSMEVSEHTPLPLHTGSGRPQAHRRRRSHDPWRCFLPFHLTFNYAYQSHCAPRQWFNTFLRFTQINSLP